MPGRKWCVRCAAVYRRKHTEVAIAAAVEKVYYGSSFEKLSVILRARVKALQITDDVFIWGDIGVGKTYLMSILIKAFMRLGYNCIRINFDSFCCRLRSTFTPRAKETEWDLIELLTDVDKLFIDDLGLRSQEETGFSYQTLYAILNKRQERMLPTYVCTNKSIEQLAITFDDRIASRLSSAVSIHLEGKDRRKEK